MDPEIKPRVTVLCTNGTNVMPIQYFAYELSSGETLSLLIERIVAGWATKTDVPLGAVARPTAGS